MSLFDLVPERFHLASDDYEELWDAILDHPSPEKALDGDPYLHYRPQYRLKRTSSAGTELSSSTTGDSWQGHADLGAQPGPPPSVDFIPFEPGTLCSYCSQNQAECTVNGSNLCLDCAQNHWGIPMDQAAITPGVPGEAPQVPQEPPEDLAEGSGALEPHEAMSQYQGDHTFVFHQANPRSMGGVTHHVLEAWDQDVPEAHVRPEERPRTLPGNYAKPVGSLSWMHGNGTIADVKVDRENQRQGLATELLRRARDIAANTRGVRPPKHSPSRTNEGEQWARSLDERLPRRIQGVVSSEIFTGWMPTESLRPTEDTPRNEHWDRSEAAQKYLGDLKSHISQHGMGPIEVTYGSSKEIGQGSVPISRKPAGYIAQGHHRWHAARELGMSHVPVTVKSFYGRPPELLDHPPGAQHEARWRDVMDKAKRMRAEKSVRLLETPTPDSPYVFAEVQGDTALHHCFVAVKGDEQGQWSCSCNWGDFGPNGPQAEERSPGSPYKKTPCSHVLATRWELQSRSMFGRNPYTGALKEDPMDILDAWFTGRFLHEAREGPAEAEQGQDYGHLQGWLAPHRNPEGTEYKGKVPGAYGRNPRATHWDDLDEDTQTKVSGTIHKALGEAPTIPNASVPGGSRNPLPAKPYQAPKTQADLVNNITNMFHSARNSDEKGEGKGYLTNGQRWYKDAHNQVKDWAKTYGIDHYHMNGATAALSPSTDWDSNLTMAHYHAKHLGTRNADGSENNQTLRLDRGHKSYAKDVKAAAKDGVDLDSLSGKRFRDMSHAEAYHAVKHQALRVDKIKRSSGGPMVENPNWGPSWQSSKNGIRAIRMMRGETEADSPDKLLSGHKVRSFHNNLYHAGHTDDVTVDSHATSLAMGAKMGASSKTLKKVLEFGNTGREKAQNSRGGYSYIADSYRQAHKNLVASGHMSADSTPADLQAITWKRWRDLMPARSAGKKGHESTEHTQKNSYPVLAALDHDADEEHHDDDEHWLDPWGGPDEPDPDLHAEEEDGWEDGEEPDDFEGPYGEEDHEDHDFTDLLTDRRKEGAMYDWTTMLRQARREVLAAEIPQPSPVPVQYLSHVPHHLATTMDEFGFEPHQAIAVPSEQWQEQHSPGAKNPASTAPPGFGDPLDPADERNILGSPYPDEKILEPGPALTNRFRGPATNAGFDVVIGAYQGPSQGGGGGGTYIQAPLNPEPPYPMVQAPSSQPVSLPPVSEEPSGGSQALASYQEGLEWLRPSGSGSDGLPGASAGPSQDNMNLAAGAEAFLRTGSVPIPGQEVNMDTILVMPPGSLGGMEHDARSRDFTPAEQDEMVREGELEGVRASNLHMLRLQGSMYEELERQLSAEDQSEASANALWW
jgi:GNAT superfamily N-acetyltransferase